MRRPRRIITFSNVVSLMALVFSMTGGALAAHHFFTHHYLINSTSQINPKVLKRLKGEPGEIGQIGPQGVTGEVGPNGKVGGRGEAYPQFLESGRTESGVFGMRANGEGQLAQTIQFRIPLLAEIAKAQVEFVGAGTSGANCKEPGQANKGFLCVYAAVETEAGEPKAFDPALTARPEGAGKLGFTLEILGSGTHPAYEGSYTVTAG